MSISGGPVARRPQSNRDLVSAPETTNLADLLERVLDKGIVVAGDITISLAGVELLSLKIRLLVASIDKAREIGIDWWQSDPFLSSGAKKQELATRAKAQELEGERDLLKERLARLERLLLASPQLAPPQLAPPQEPDHEYSKAEPRSNAAPAYILDKQGKVIAELKQPAEEPQADERPQAPERAPQPVEQPHEEERPQGSRAPERVPQPEAQQNAAPARVLDVLDVLDNQDRAITELKQLAHLPQADEGLQAPEHAQRLQAPEGAPQPQAAQAEPPTGAEPLLGKALQEHIAQADSPALEKVHLRTAQVPPLAEQGRPEGQRREERAQEEEQPRAPERVPQPQEEERPQGPERAPQPQAAQTEQPAGAGPLVGQVLQQHLAQAMRPVLRELRQRTVQVPPLVEQGRPEGQRREERAQEEEQPQAPERASQPQEEERPQAPERAPQPQAAQNPAPASVLDEEARKIAELKQPGEPPQEEEQPQVPERALQPEAAQVEQPAGVGPLLGQALQERIAQAMRPVLEELPQRIAHARQPGEQGRPEGQRGEEQAQE